MKNDCTLVICGFGAVGERRARARSATRYASQITIVECGSDRARQADDVRVLPQLAGEMLAASTSAN